MEHDPDVTVDEAGFAPQGNHMGFAGYLAAEARARGMTPSIGREINFFNQFFPTGAGTYLAVVDHRTVTIGAHKLDERAQKLITKTLEADTKARAAKERAKVRASKKKAAARKKEAARRKRVANAIATLKRDLR